MGLDLSHIIPVNFDENPDGNEIIEYEELDKYPGWRTAFDNYLSNDEELNCYRLYYKQLGYQRKCVSHKFYNLFKEGFYFELEDFEKVYGVLKSDDVHTLQELQKSFQQNFLKNFIAGKSVLFVSY